LPDAPMMCNDKSKETIITMLAGRHLAQTYPVDLDEWPKFVSFFKKFWLKVLSRKYGEGVRPVLQIPELGEWNNSNRFEPWKVKENDNADWVMRTTPVDKVTAWRWAKFGCFPKVEKTEKSDAFGVKPDFKPRSIETAKPEARVATGRKFYALQKAIEEMLPSHIQMATGMNPATLSDFYARHFNKPQVGWDDFTLYDSSECKELQDLDEWLYRQFDFEGDQYVCDWADLIRHAQTVIGGYGPYGVKFEVRGTLKSGVADTCLSNSVNNIAAHCYAIFRDNQENWDIIFNGHSMAMVVLGDDNILNVQQGVRLSRVPTFISQLGLIPKFFFSYDDTEMTFLNMRPYPAKKVIHFRSKKRLTVVPHLFYCGMDKWAVTCSSYTLLSDDIPSNWEKVEMIEVANDQEAQHILDARNVEARFGPKIARLIARLGVSTEPREQWQSYLCGVARAFAFSTNHIPMLRSYIQRVMWLMRHFNRGFEKSFKFTREHRYNLAARECRLYEACSETVSYVQQVYGVAENEQKEVEAMFRTLPCVQVVIGHPALSACYLVDA